MQGGSVGLESELGKGSFFRAILECPVLKNERIIDTISPSIYKQVVLATKIPEIASSIGSYLTSLGVRDVFVFDDDSQSGQEEILRRSKAFLESQLASQVAVILDSPFSSLQSALAEL